MQIENLIRNEFLILNRYGQAFQVQRHCQIGFSVAENSLT